MQHQVETLKVCEAQDNVGSALTPLQAKAPQVLEEEMALLPGPVAGWRRKRQLEHRARESEEAALDENRLETEPGRVLTWDSILDGSLLDNQPPEATQPEPRLLARQLRASAGEIPATTRTVGKVVMKRLFIHAISEMVRAVSLEGRSSQRSCCPCEAAGQGESRAVPR